MSQYAVPPPPTGGATSNAYVGASATATSGVIKASAGKLLALHVAVTGQAGTYFHLYDKASAPAPGDVAAHSFLLAGAVYQVLPIDAGFFTQSAEAFLSGIAWGISTSPAVYAAASNNPTTVNARFV